MNSKKINLLARIKDLYENGENIIQYLKSLENTGNNSIEDILISYDFQAGSYTKIANEKCQIRDDYYQSIANVLNKLGKAKSLLEVGVGEATTLANVLKRLNALPDSYYGFDIAWSRIKYARKFMKAFSYSNDGLFTGDLFNAPIKSNSVDIVYSSHSIEPNGGREEEALKELYRITGRYLVLLEPGYEYASEEGKQRMQRLGYVRNLAEIAKKLKYKIIEERKFDISINPLNPTGLIIIEKNTEMVECNNPIACPVTQEALQQHDDCYFSEKALLAYPIISGIPCLLPQNAIVATHFAG